MKSALPPYLFLGKILRPHGLGGTLKISLTSDPKKWPPLKEVWIDHPAGWQALSVTKSAMRNGFWYLDLEGITSIEAALNVRNRWIAVPANQMPELAPGEYYQTALTGAEVVDAAGKVLGRVERVVNHPACDFLVVEGGASNTVPMSKSVIASIDTAAQKIILKVPFES